MKAIALVIVPVIWMLVCTVPITVAATDSHPSRFDLIKLRKFYDAKDLNPDVVGGGHCRSNCLSTAEGLPRL